MIDFHAHVLPGLDDGAEDVQEAISLLLSQKEQGVETVIATPHYMGKMTIQEFLDRRQTSLERLLLKMPEAAPRVIPAAEVGLFYGISGVENIEALCVAGTPYMLIEMPQAEWSSWVFEELQHLTAKGIRPIIAHLDRYMHLSKEVKKLLGMPVILQVNAGAICNLRGRRCVSKLLKAGKSFILGSDCHHTIKRPCRLQEACHVIEKKWGKILLCEILKKGETLLHSESMIDRI
ncbi:MAG: hypothetical protein E7418_01470 [Ruminococcaceae bacterium]|nr:hypothetical protein [Oscillospiraceae bacterium]